MALQAGVGRVDVTPAADIPNGMWMAQRHVRAEGIHQELWLTALALADGDERVLLLDLDWCLLSDAQDRRLRAAVAAATGVPAERVLPCSTHNHAGPVTQDTYQGEGADEVAAYVRSIDAKAVEACRAALDRLEPARVAAGRGESDIGVNRDLRLPEGRAVAGPNPDGPADRSVGVVRIEREGGAPLAILVNYACHPTVLGPDNKLVSPDYPGTTKRVVEAQLGAPCLFLQGAHGDMGPVEGFVGDAAVAERLGTRLGLEAAKVALGLDARPVRRRLERVIPSGAPLTVFVDEPTGEPPPRLVVRSGRARLPVRDPLPDVLAGAAGRMARWSDELDARRRAGADPRAIAEAHQNLERERLRHVRFEAFHAAEHAETELQAVVLGPVALLLTWGEPYSAIGLDIKRRSPFASTLVVSCLGGDPTYVATPAGFEPPQPFQIDNCTFTPAAAAALADAAVALLEDASTAAARP
jgi:hypothetical protein